MLRCLPFILLFTFSKAHAQVDVQHYDFRLVLSDASDTLHGTASVTLKILQNTKTIALNLACLKNGKGMQVLGVQAGKQSFLNVHAHDTLYIHAAQDFKKDSVQTFTINYAGVPADGLIISKNKWGERSFFADNWPNRARQWLPCNDRPDDKATVDFWVTAPAKYKIIANGSLVSEKNISAATTETHWHEAAPLPTKVMVIGAARFAVKTYADSSVVPVSAWVYPQDSAAGFFDYALAPSILKFYTNYIGPYPFEKLANVQSKTIFGGMENAGAIFYGEKAVTGTQQSEALLSHEIAHQWFGDAATEKSFAHLWLSEGFATYFTNLYLENKYGRDTLAARLQEDRKAIIQFARTHTTPVVDSVSPLLQLLNVNSYQKGGWVLHMLRNEVGDSVFKTIIQEYYKRYKGSNADTWAFEKVAEDVSGKKFDWFFSQWLYRPGVPQLHVAWTWENEKLLVTVHQLQKHPLSFPLTIGVYGDLKKLALYQFNVTKPFETFKIVSEKKTAHVVLDPETSLLFEGTISEKPSH